MDGFIPLLIFAVFFYFMMRFGCGAHGVHGHGKHSSKEEYIDPVCGAKVDKDKGYGKMHEGRLFRFCSRRCLDTFDENPAQYSQQHHHHHEEH